MYLAIVALTMLILPVASIFVEHGLHPTMSWIALTGRWVVFWAVGIRLGLAGIRQLAQPGFTAREIFSIDSDKALPVIRELGTANLGAGILGVASLWRPDFILPAAISAGLFYLVAGAIHAFEQHRSSRENIAMISDFFVGLILAFYAVAGWSIAV